MRRLVLALLLTLPLTTCAESGIWLCAEYEIIYQDSDGPPILRGYDCELYVPLPEGEFDMVT